MNTKISLNLSNKQIRNLERAGVSLKKDADFINQFSYAELAMEDSWKPYWNAKYQREMWK